MTKVMLQNVKFFNMTLFFIGFLLYICHIKNNNLFYMFEQLNKTHRQLLSETNKNLFMTETETFDLNHENLSNVANNVAMITHDADSDGILSGSIAYNLVEQITSILDTSEKTKVNIFGYNNEGETEKSTIWWNKNTNVNFDTFIFTDVTPSIEWLKQLDSTQKVIIYDHHESFYLDFIKNIENFKCVIHYVYNKKLSASGIIFQVHKNFGFLKFLFKFLNNDEFLALDHVNKIESMNNDVDDLVNIIDYYDVWKWYENFKNNGDKLAYIMYFGLMETFEKFHINVSEYVTFDKALKDFSEILKTENFIDFKNCVTYAFKNGSSRTENLINQSKNRKFDVVKNYNGRDYDIAYYVGQVDFWLNEHILKSHPSVGICLSIKTAKVDLFKISARGFKNINCYEFLGEISKGNAGGHFNSAGAVLDLDQYYDFVKYDLGGEE